MPGSDESAETTASPKAPPLGGRNWHHKHQQTLTQGQRAADLMRNGMGSWPFIGVFVALMLLWAAVNSLFFGNRSWDPYPYILLNLVLSMLAGLQGAILLIAAKRQDAISAAMAQHDYETDVAAKTEIDRLIRLSEEHREMISELHRLLSGPGIPNTANGPPPAPTARQSRSTRT
jgi:uncharacterized membrane protein